MKITIEPTTDQSRRSSQAQQLRVTIEHPSDDLTMNEAAELARAAFLAWGYQPENVRESLGEG